MELEKGREMIAALFILDFFQGSGGVHPFLQAVAGLEDVFAGAGEGHAHGAVAVMGVEIDAGGAGDFGFVEDAAAERDGVVGEVVDIGVEIESALRVRKFGEAAFGEFAF
jgi:hypothetical protein